MLVLSVNWTRKPIWPNRVFLIIWLVILQGMIGCKSGLVEKDPENIRADGISTGEDRGTLEDRNETNIDSALFEVPWANFEEGD